VTATIHRGRVGEFETIILQNDRLRAVVIPELGGRVWELLDRKHDRQWVWHRPGVQPRSVPAGTSYDEVWAGGWEELFPNDALGRFEGRDLPDHGEWWTLPWCVDSTLEGESATLTLTAVSSIVRTRCKKEFRLGAAGSTLEVRYSVLSEEQQPFHFLFKQHLPVAITPACRLLLPGGRVTPVDPQFSSLLPPTQGFDWPVLESSAGPIDLSVIPSATSRLQEFIYVDRCPASWCGVVDPDAGAALRMDYDGITLPYVWLFLTYGGWRDLYTAVLEPCTNMPKNLAEAVRLGQSARLEPGQEFTTRANVTLGDAAAADTENQR
jgi:hypothetical protein